MKGESCLTNVIAFYNETTSLVDKWQSGYCLSLL